MRRNPQLGRFLGVDPLAASGGQDMFSPYAAMGNAPESMVDPNGMQYENANAHKVDNVTCEPASVQGPPTQDPLGGNNSFSDKVWGGGFAAMLQMAADNRQREAAKQQGESKTQGDGRAASNLKEEEKEYGSEGNPFPLAEVTIFSNPSGELNVMQAAALDIGRNDYNRWKVENFRMIILGQLGIGASALIAPALIIEGVPFVFSSFLSNPTVYIEGAAGVVMGAHGYEAGLPSAGAAGKGTGRVFWSGGDDVMGAATSYAQSTGQITLGMTRAGQNLQNLITSKNIPWSEARPMWARLSTIYAKGAKESVHFFGVENAGSIWMQFEKPILIKNKVKIIFR